MNKRLSLAALVAAIALAFAGTSKADRPPYPNRPLEGTSNVIQTCAQAQQIYNVTVSSQVPQVVVYGSSITASVISPWRKARIQNLDSSNDLFFSYDQNVSTAGTQDGHGGYKLYPSTGAAAGVYTFDLMPGVSYYMMSDSSGAPGRTIQAVVEVCR